MSTSAEPEAPPIAPRCSVLDVSQAIEEGEEESDYVEAEMQEEKTVFDQTNNQAGMLRIFYFE